VLATIGLVLAVAAPPANAGARADARFATFNASLNRADAGLLIEDLSTGDDAQAQAVAEIIQRTRPEVLLVNEFDYDDADGGDSLAARLFQENYLSVAQNGAEPIEYRYRLAFPSNTGVHSGFDLDRNGEVVNAPGAGRNDHAGDAFGFGVFEGQYAFVVYSQHPILEHQVRTFQHFLWADMPGALLPQNPDGSSYYTDEELAVLRLSSKNHVDVPVRIGGEVIHLLASHPTPPVFDGPEDRNGRRNHDEIRFWADYIDRRSSRYIYDDEGRRGGLRPGSEFVIAGDLNADPNDGDSVAGAANQLLDSRRVNSSTTPASAGGPDRALAQGQQNLDHVGDPANDTADFGEGEFGAGNLRVDYVLPSRGLRIADAGIFWPASGDELFRLTGEGFPAVSSDHRLVWVDLRLGGRH
jgi:3-phytase